MLLNKTEEDQICKQLKNKTSNLSKEPPLLKYEYWKIGSQFQAEISAESSNKLNAKDKELKIEQLLL